jgi:hypothetical protein
MPSAPGRATGSWTVTNSQRPGRVRANTTVDAGHHGAAKQSFQSKVKVRRVDERSEIHRCVWWVSLRSSTTRAAAFQLFLHRSKDALNEAA